MRPPRREAEGCGHRDASAGGPSHAPCPQDVPLWDRDRPKARLHWVAGPGQKERKKSPGWMAQWVGALPHTTKGGGSIPGQPHA